MINFFSLTFNFRKIYFSVLNLLTFHMSVTTYSCIIIYWVVFTVEMGGVIWESEEFCSFCLVAKHTIRCEL